MPADDGWMEELADESAAELSKRFNGIYSQAWREMRGKLERAMADYERERKERMKALDDTPEAKRAFGKWCESRLANAQWLEAMADELAARAADADELAMAAVRNETPRVYAENANMAAYAIEGAMGAYTGYTLLDGDTVRLLAMESGALVPEVPYPKTQRAKDVRWNRRKFRSAITQGILQGESVPKVAKRVQSVIGMDSRAATRAARTALTGAQNAGRVNAYRRMADEGCRLKQEWMATRDIRTRDSHRRLDGERVEIGESWQAERGELRFPGDPQAHPAETWNCRCRVRAVVDVKGLKAHERINNFPSGLTYEQWKAGKKARGNERQRKAWNGVVRESGAISGALNNANDPDGVRRLSHAESYYREIRERNKGAEITRVAGNSGISESHVSKAYDHLFVNEYDLADGHHRFHEDYEIAQSWQRLSEGKEIKPHDLTLIQHESYEYDLMNSGMGYEEAHKITEEVYNYRKGLLEYWKQEGVG
jgi:SPP1 gp7 family putative phage head morphogenesis protein